MVRTEPVEVGRQSTGVRCLMPREHGAYAVTASAIWGVIFSLGTFTVRAVIAGVKRSANPGRPSYALVALSLAVIAAVFLVSIMNTLPKLAVAAVLPSAFIALACNLLRVHPRHLRTMGWSMVASNVIAFVALLAGLR